MFLDSTYRTGPARPFAPAPAEAEATALLAAAPPYGPRGTGVT